MQDFATVDADTVRNLDFMEAVHRMKAEFYRSVIATAETTDLSTLHVLRQEPLYQLAEFLFSLKANEIVSAQGLERLAQLHNQHLAAIGQDPVRMREFGLTPERLQAALFADDQLAKLHANFLTSAAIDQSDLARLLVAVMSPETCRKLLVAADAAGFVKRQRSPYGAMLIRSTGVLETILEKVLGEARRNVCPAS
ncbi:MULTISPECIES: hypothetical protein [Devosia]|uniref:hypothetical protein n=1 Tax=Devosia TaxID=46913 RepID=UPI000CE985F3|nr:MULTISPECIES: hypothetical protein [Devosia]AVF02940.1 hypothetical protein C4375_03770 [Devosia sp. I507]